MLQNVLGNGKFLAPLLGAARLALPAQGPRSTAGPVEGGFGLSRAG